MFIALFNVGDSARTVTIPVLDALRDGDVLRDVWSAMSCTVMNRQICDFQVPARTGMVLEKVSTLQ